MIQRSVDAHVEYVVNVGYDLKSSKKALQMADEYDGLYATIGIHPHNAISFTENTIDKLRRLAEHPKVVAIGEIGLDYYRKLSPRDIQKETFEAQMKLAQEMALPIVVHNREAHAETIKIIRKFEGNIRGVMHCFSGSLETAEECIKLGYMISFAGPVTFPNAEKLHKIARKIPSDRILLETDCPWLAPQNKRGERNEPAYLCSIAEKTAELREVSLSRFVDITTSNAKEIFQIKGISL